MAIVNLKRSILSNRLSEVAAAQDTAGGVNSATAIVTSGQKGGGGGGVGTVRAVREAVKIKTKLCSTKLTQNGTIVRRTVQYFDFNDFYVCHFQCT